MLDHPLVWVAAVLAVLWLLASLKTWRPDGDLLRDVHPYRRLMGFIMRSRSESVVFIDSELRAEKLQAFLARHEAAGLTMTHVLLACLARAFEQHPRLNRFLAGKRLYQRRGVFATFSMKRKKLAPRSKVATVKLQLDPEEPIVALAGRIDAKIAEQRSDARTRADKEFALLNLLPRPLLTAAAAALRQLDAFNLLPAWWMRDDDLYTSVFVANLGSLDMTAAYHHLFEYGNCPLFLTVGRIEERPVVEEGSVVAGAVLPLRWTFDERIEDGLTARGGLDAFCRLLENPAAAFATGEPKKK